MIDRPIVILGFGRSGTTWLSDIVSKVLGGLVLFEPLHPQVCEFAAEVCYAPSPSLGENKRLQAHWQRLLGGQMRDRWLLRNHVLSPLEDVSAPFVDMVWNHCQVIGFKEIRANFMIDLLIEQLDARIVYVVRHPCAVLASIRRRRNFWNEFGWEQHYRMFWERVIGGWTHGWPEAQAQIEARQEIIDGAHTALEQQAVMWGVSSMLAAMQLERQGLPLFCYEDFYRQPFEATGKLMAYLGREAPAIHPAHLFVPSMTTLRTTHGLAETESDMAARGLRLFWEGVLAEDEVQSVIAIAQAFGFDQWYGDAA